MLIIETVPLLRQEVRHWRQQGKRVAFVPTMGNLHDGHMALVNAARANADVVIVSIFVNPMQFDRPEDLQHYPRTQQQDYEKLMYQGVDLVFSPSAQEIYPQGLSEQTYVDVPALSTLLEGANRPGHFRGVATVVSKLFNLVQPDVACFGEKDYQQLALIRKLVVDMGYAIDIIPVPIVRAKDGLALSSRNGYLTADERCLAPKLPKIMNELALRIEKGARNFNELLAQTTSRLHAAGFKPDGLFIRDADTLLDVKTDTKKIVILLAAWLGDKARLIDNQVVVLVPRKIGQ